ncbi:TPA: hypothetical protein ENX78_17135 [Candidatus Poribacteria bacterium]|nr:hypothetical protein [Candidatus Poribacteria bacterium]
MRIFKRKKDEFVPKNEFFDIPVGSIIELSDMATFNLEDRTSQSFEVRGYKKYEADGFLRYMYDLIDGEEIILGVDVDPSTKDFQLARFVINSEEEWTEPLGDTIVMDFEDPENENEIITVEYYRDNIINTKMTTVNSEGSEEYYDIELQDYSAEDGSILMVELWESYFTFYVGEPLEKGDVNVFPINPDEKK